MPCQVGMTTRPNERKEEWKRERPTLRNWEILHRVRTRSEAQRLETQEANTRGCNSGEGGDGPENGDWRVYYFQY